MSSSLWMERSKLRFCLQAIELLEALTSDCQHNSAVLESCVHQAAGPDAQGAAQHHPQQQQHQQQHQQHQQRPWWHTSSLLGQLGAGQQQHGSALISAWGSLTGMLAKHSQALGTAACVTLPGSHNLGQAGLPSTAADISVSLPEANQMDGTGTLHDAPLVRNCMVQRYHNLQMYYFNIM